MTWSKFDDAAPKSPKAVSAGNDAWGLWAAAVMYCNRHNTDGYVTIAALATDCLPVPITLTKARKLADALCAARARPDGKGLFESDQKDMYRVHDFLDWNPSKVEVESKRKKDRDRKRGAPESEQTPRGIPDGKTDIPDRIPDGRRADSETPRASARALPSRPVPPVPALPAPEPRLMVADTDRETVCPADLQSRAEAAGIFTELATALGAQADALREECGRFVGYWAFGAGAGKKRAHWMARLRQRLVERVQSGEIGKAEPEAIIWP